MIRDTGIEPGSVCCVSTDEILWFWCSENCPPSHAASSLFSNDSCADPTCGHICCYFFSSGSRYCQIFEVEIMSLSFFFFKSFSVLVIEQVFIEKFRQRLQKTTLILSVATRSRYLAWQWDLYCRCVLS